MCGHVCWPSLGRDSVYAGTRSMAQNESYVSAHSVEGMCSILRKRCHRAEPESPRQHSESASVTLHDSTLPAGRYTILLLRSYGTDNSLQRKTLSRRPAKLRQEYYLQKPSSLSCDH